MNGQGNKEVGLHSTAGHGEYLYSRHVCRQCQRVCAVINKAFRFAENSALFQALVPR